MTDVIRNTMIGAGTVSVDEPVARAETVAAVDTYVDWGSIIAGVVVAAAISIVLGAFGAGIGLSLASPYDGASPLAHYIALALWLLWITVASFVSGGYVAGRLRKRVGDGGTPEAEVRDGAHGLVLWSTTMVLLALLTGVAGASIYQLAKGGPSVLATEAMNREMGVSSLDYRVDALLRGFGGEPLATRAPAPGLGAAPAPGAVVGVSEFTRQAVTRILARTMATGEISGDDRAYLVSVVASRSGVSAAEADRRVETVLADMRRDRDRMRELTEQARKTGVMTTFLSVAAMLIGAGAAWGGGVLGGRHRDENVGVDQLVGWPSIRRRRRR